MKIINLSMHNKITIYKDSCIKSYKKEYGILQENIST